MSDERNNDSETQTEVNNFRRLDSLDLEARKVRSHSIKGSGSWWMILQLAFQSLGIVYGDIGTSPLYVYSSVFPDGIKYNDDILGVLSLIFYTLTLIPLTKYVFIVLQATDNGDGGTFALYSLICRYARVGLTPNEQEEDRNVSNFRIELPSRRAIVASKLKSMLERSKISKYILLLATMLGTSMVIGDGVLTPCISVLSAVGGIKEAKPSISQDVVVWISVAILIILFMVQRLGTDKVGYSFAPIICLWFSLIAGIGIYNFVKFDPTVIKAVNPKYIVDYFRRNKTEAWISLGGIVLATTGSEALFADVGHFTVTSIKISMCAVTYPALMLAYAGQASFLRQHRDLVKDTFYASIPKPVFWPMFGVAVAAAIIASQAMISGTFSIIQQALAMGCFPRVKIVHTSAKYKGQVYVPEANYILMIACLAVTLGFRDTTTIGNAYGIAVLFVMTLTSAFLVLTMVMIWKTHALLVIAYVLVICSVEFVYLSSVLYKFKQGGYLPLAFAAILTTIMFIWNDVYRRKYYYELEHKMSPRRVKEITSESSYCRLPGLGMFYSELVQDIPPIFKHYAANIPALHSVLVFVSIKSLPVSKVPPEERFLFRRVDHQDLYIFRCAARYGYTDLRHEPEPFEQILIEKLKEFVRNEFLMTRRQSNAENEAANAEIVTEEVADQSKLLEKELEELDRARGAGVVHLVGEHEIVAKKGAGIFKRILIDYSYNFLKKNLRQSEKVFDIPHKRMVKVGMTYEL